MTEKNKLENREELVKNKTKQADKKETEKETKSLSDEEKKVAKKASEKKISKDDAKKEVAREEVKSQTGYSAESLAEVGRTVLKTQDSFSKPDSAQTADNMKKVKGNAVEGMLEKMVDPKVAKKIVQAGLGSEFASTGESGLEQGARTVLEKQREFGGSEGLSGLLAKMVLFGKGMSLEEIRKLTPDKLKEHSEKINQNPSNSVAAKTNSEPPKQRDKQVDPSVRKAWADKRGMGA
ncbi:MAG: hypothetical protein IJV07_06010 [Alphaproteobacteria bacterium]|nr:hypothetical protein [Alphaproteobacteria bacterium]